MAVKRTLVLFDIDGTLIRADGAGRRGFTTAFEEVFELPEAFAGEPFSGRTDLDLVHSACERHLGRSPSPGEVEAFFAAYCRELEPLLSASTGYQVLPAVVEMLEALEAEPDRYGLGLATGNHERGALLKLQRGGLDRFFPFGGYGSDHRLRLELTRLARQRGLDFLRCPAEEAEVVVIGDSIHDVRCARELGARAVAVCTGWTPAEELAAEGPDVLVDDLTGWASWLT